MPHKRQGPHTSVRYRGVRALFTESELFNLFAVVIDKSQLIEMKGLHFKPSFYKFTNNIVHKELKRAFREITIVADEIGGSEYMQSFAKYVKERQDIPNLLNDAAFRFENMKGAN